MNMECRSLIECSDGLIGKVIGCAIEVHKTLGPGLLESAYELALVHELAMETIGIKNQINVPVIYKGQNLGTGFRADLIVEDSLIVEIKTVEEIGRIHTAQLITYLKLVNIKCGLIINFNTRLLKDGIKRISI